MEEEKKPGETLSRLGQSKEERIKKITQFYYSRKDIQKAIFSFSANREIAPSYMMESFGTRPDYFQYPADIFELVKKGATSFHCSEELWADPLKISTGMGEKQLNELRTGWDLIIDIDCKWFDFSKKAVQAIIKALEFRGIKNIGIKFSGSKGFHILIPSKSFPEELNGILTKNMFPEWPRITISYLKELSRPILEDLIKKDSDVFTKVSGYSGIKCENCKNLAIKSYQITLICNNHKVPHIEIFFSSESYQSKKCPDCNSMMIEKDKKEVYLCDKCGLNSLKNPKNFNKGKISADIFKILGLDLQLVSPRHLFRMPYSLHEKTALASVVLKPEEIKDFQPKDADPFKAEIRNFMPDAKPGEASELLREALDWYKTQHPEQETERPGREFKPIILKEISEKNFPPSINKILQGIKGDGRKRALFIIMNFFRSIGMERKEVEKTLSDWNQKNELPLKEGYIKSQLISSYRGKPIPPPNYDKDYYKGIGIIPTEEEVRYKNPVSYTVRKTLMGKNVKESKNKK